MEIFGIKVEDGPKFKKRTYQGAVLAYSRRLKDGRDEFIVSISTKTAPVHFFTEPKQLSFWKFMKDLFKK